MSARLPGRVQAWVIDPLRDFLRQETSGGFVLLAATVAALVWANGPFAHSYDQVWHADLTIGWGRYAITETLQHWVNDALMTVFFFVVGLEIKRELVTGELRDPRTAVLPVVAAVGGMVVPAALYALLNANGEGSPGWGIPMATDIAFAVGVLVLFGSRLPGGLKLFLLTLAIVDDIGAILVIAVFYSSGIRLGWLEVALVGLLIVGVMRLFRIPKPLIYVPVGAVIWLATFESGIHPTIAGVAIALITPARPVRGRSVLLELEHRLHPLSSYVIVPLFALANAGVAVNAGAIAEAVRSPIFWGIPLGLLVGKTVGISATTLAAARLGVGRLPAGVNAGHVLGVSALAGIGFTVSLFITSLAFRGEELIGFAKMGVLAGSLASAIVGGLILATRRTEPEVVVFTASPATPPRND